MSRRSLTGGRDLVVRDRDPGDEFEILGMLGQGSYGEVWKGRSYETNEVVAVKIVPYEDDDDSDLRREIEILDRARDPFIITFFGAYEKNHHIWMVMELAEAGSVNDLMFICDVALEESLIRVLTASALLGLVYLHNQRMIHRDIKAGNILLTRSGHAKLADFGVSAKLNTIESKRRTVIGTPFWMAPEVIQESTYDAKADVWSLGITLIELADREPPYSEIHPMRAIFMIPSRAPPTFENESFWSSDMISFLRRCLVKVPDGRASSQELLSHPFIAQEVKNLNEANPRGFSQALFDLVKSCVDEIQQFRDEEATKLQDAQKATLQQPQKDPTRNNTAVLKSPSTPTGASSPHSGLKQAQPPARPSSIASSAASGVPRASVSSRVSGRSQLRLSQLSVQQTGTMVLDKSTDADGKNVSQATASGTMQLTGASGPEPDFMQYFMNEDQNMGHPLQHGQQQGGHGLAKQETEALTKGLTRLNQQFRTDFMELKRQYEKRREALMGAAGIKA